MSDGIIEYSVVIPLYNEDANIKPLCSLVKAVMDRLDKPYEIIFVDDGSNDKTLYELRKVSRPGFNVIVLARHYGQSIALQAGFSNVRGAVIITMDGDLQNDPQDIPRLLQKLNKGYDMVCGWRKERQDPLTRRIASLTAALIRRMFFREPVHDVGCTLRVFKREAIKGVFLSSGMHRFLTLIISRLGYKITEIEVRHHPRRFCKSKYNIRNRLIAGLILACRFLSFDVHELIKQKTEFRIKEII